MNRSTSFESTRLYNKKDLSRQQQNGVVLLSFLSSSHLPRATTRAPTEKKIEMAITMNERFDRGSAPEMPSILFILSQQKLSLLVRGGTVASLSLLRAHLLLVSLQHRFSPQFFAMICCHPLRVSGHLALSFTLSSSITFHCFFLGQALASELS